MRVVKAYDDNGEWCGLYVNGELIQEGHRVSFYDFMEYLVGECVIESYVEREAVIEDSCPQDIEKVEFV